MKNRFHVVNIAVMLLLCAAIRPVRGDPNVLWILTDDQRYDSIAQTLKEKLLNIVIGDGRVEVDWGEKATGTKPVISNFAPGADDKELGI